MADEFPLHTAVMSWNIIQLDALISQGYNINAKDPHGLTPLILAVHCNFEVAVDLLLNRGADISVATPNGFTPIYDAIFQRNLIILKMLINNDERVINTAINHYTPLSWAIFRNFVPGVNFLLEKGADVNFEDMNGLTSIFHAIERFGPTDLLTLLIERGANVNHRNHEGATALHVAVLINAERYVKLLLDAGARLDILDMHRISPLDVALSNTSQRALVVIKCHIIALQVVNIPVHLTNHVDLSSSVSYRESCLKELKRMKLKKINNRSLCDVFYKYKNPDFVLNCGLEEMVKLKELVLEFPIYTPILKLTFEKAKDRYEYLNQALMCFDTMCFDILPVEIKRFILSFLSDEELKFLSKCLNRE